MIIFTLLLIICLSLVIYTYTPHNLDVNESKTTSDESQDYIIPSEEEIKEISQEEFWNMVHTPRTSYLDYFYIMLNVLVKIVIYITAILLFKMLLSLLVRGYGLYLAQKYIDIGQADTIEYYSHYLWIMIQVLFYESNYFNSLTRKLFIFLLSLTQYFKEKSLDSIIEDNITSILRARKKIFDKIYFRQNVYLYIHLFYNVLYYNLIKFNKSLLNVDVKDFNEYINNDGYMTEQEKIFSPQSLFTSEEKNILTDHFKKSENVWQEIKKIVYQEFIELILNLPVYWEYIRKYGFFFQNVDPSSYDKLIEYLNNASLSLDEKCQCIIHYIDHILESTLYNTTVEDNSSIIMDEHVTVSEQAKQQCVRSTVLALENIRKKQQFTFTQEYITTLKSLCEIQNNANRDGNDSD